MGRHPNFRDSMVTLLPSGTLAALAGMGPYGSRKKWGLIELTDQCAIKRVGTGWGTCTWINDRIVESPGEMVSDPWGNIYLAGQFNGSTCRIGAFALKTTASGDLPFVAAIDPRTLLPIWAEEVGSPVQYFAELQIAVDRSGQVFLSNLFSGTATFGATKVTSRGKSDIYVWKRGVVVPSLKADAGVPRIPDLALPRDSWRPQDMPTRPTWANLPTGSFTSGSPLSEPCRAGKETQRTSSILRRLQVQTTEVTQGQFQAVMGYNPSTFKSCGSTCPVDAAWAEAASYCNALSVKAGLSPCYTCWGTPAFRRCDEATAYKWAAFTTCPGYRLPTSEEWEYAYRSGSTTAFYNGANDSTVCNDVVKKDTRANAIAWYAANSQVTYAGCQSIPGGSTCNGPHPVGLKTPNAWGLYDMAGNAAEWVHYPTIVQPNGTLDYPVRNGSWFDTAAYLRAAGETPEAAASVNGFRCIRTL